VYHRPHRHLDWINTESSLLYTPVGGEAGIPLDLNKGNKSYLRDEACLVDQCKSICLVRIAAVQETLPFPMFVPMSMPSASGKQMITKRENAKPSTRRHTLLE
jgi:hypothetical protein